MPHGVGGTVREVGNGIQSGVVTVARLPFGPHLFCSKAKTICRKSFGPILDMVSSAGD